MSDKPKAVLTIGVDKEIAASIASRIGAESVLLVHHRHPIEEELTYNDKNIRVLP